MCVIMPHNCSINTFNVRLALSMSGPTDISTDIHSQPIGHISRPMGHLRWVYNGSRMKHKSFSDDIGCEMYFCRLTFGVTASENGFAPLLCRSTTRMYKCAPATVFLHRKSNITTPVSLCKFNTISVGYNFYWIRNHVYRPKEML